MIFEKLQAKRRHVSLQIPEPTFQPAAFIRPSAFKLQARDEVSSRQSYPQLRFRKYHDKVLPPEPLKPAPLLGRRETRAMKDRPKTLYGPDADSVQEFFKETSVVAEINHVAHLYNRFGGLLPEITFHPNSHILNLPEPAWDAQRIARHYKFDLFYVVRLSRKALQSSIRLISAHLLCVFGLCALPYTICSSMYRIFVDDGSCRNDSDWRTHNLSSLPPGFVHGFSKLVQSSSDSDDILLTTCLYKDSGNIQLLSDIRIILDQDVNGVVEMICYNYHEFTPRVSFY